MKTDTPHLIRMAIRAGAGDKILTALVDLHIHEQTRALAAMVLGVLEDIWCALKHALQY